MALNPETIIRAWQDESFRDSLSVEERAELPPAPDGASQMTSEALAGAAGGVAIGPIIDPLPEPIHTLPIDPIVERAS